MISDMYRNFFKRVIDFLISAVALLLIGWFLCIIAGLLYLANGRSGVFFLQDRPGKDGKIFRIIKFKTMNDKRDPQGNLLPDMQRITRLGAFLRSTSIDELPQLLNVLKGDMALIGPRPLLVEYLPLYSPEQARRHDVRPGISGWAQVNGRNNLTWGEKFKLDVWYVDHVSIWLDIKIALRTVLKVINSSDINNSSDSLFESTMDRFDGTN